MTSKPSDKLFLEELLSLYDAPPWRVAWRDGTPFFMDQVRRQLLQARRGEGDLESRAFGAWMGFRFHDRVAVDAFLEGLFWSWNSFTEEKRSALREALFVVLRKHYLRPANEIFADPPPWLNPASRNPKGYLATRIDGESRTILADRDKRDEFLARMAEAPLAASLGPGSDVPDRQRDALEQAIDQVAAKGRAVSRARARVLRRALREGWELEETIEGVGGPDAWRAIKLTLENELKKIS